MILFEMGFDVFMIRGSILMDIGLVDLLVGGVVQDRLFKVL